MRWQNSSENNKWQQQENLLGNNNKLACGSGDSITVVAQWGAAINQGSSSVVTAF